MNAAGIGTPGTLTGSAFIIAASLDARRRRFAGRTAPKRSICKEAPFRKIDRLPHRAGGAGFQPALAGRRPAPRAGSLKVLGGYNLLKTPSGGVGLLRFSSGPVRLLKIHLDISILAKRAQGFQNSDCLLGVAFLQRRHCKLRGCLALPDPN